VVRVITMLGEEILRRAADRAKEMGVTQVETVSAQGDPADAILDMAEAAGADMIVLGHRGLGRLKTMLLGSVALKVTQHAPCTVVSVR
jgi:nucleotide-binding universal stress UspA family protein